MDNARIASALHLIWEDTDLILINEDTLLELLCLFQYYSRKLMIFQWHENSRKQISSIMLDLLLYLIHFQ